jgi:hypothetical protein
MPQRNCTKIKADVVSPNKRITLPIRMEQYQEIVGDHRAYREWVDEMIVQYAELFPKEVVGGYSLHDERASEKMEGMRLRRICLKACDSEGKKQVFTLAPSGIHRQSGEGVVLATFRCSFLGIGICVWARRQLLVSDGEPLWAF